MPALEHEQRRAGDGIERLHPPIDERRKLPEPHDIVALGVARQSQSQRDCREGQHGGR